MEKIKIQEEIPEVITIEEIPQEYILVDEIFQEEIEIKETEPEAITIEEFPETKEIIVEKIVKEKGVPGKTPTKKEIVSILKEVFPEDKLIEKILKKIPKKKELSEKELVTKILAKIPKEGSDDLELGEDRGGKFIKKGDKKYYLSSGMGGAVMSSGVHDFILLRDTPNTYEGQAGKVVKVKADETGLEYGIDSDAQDLQSVTEQGATTTITSTFSGGIISNSATFYSPYQETPVIKIYTPTDSNPRLSFFNGDDVEMFIEPGDGYLMMPQSSLIIYNADGNNPTLELVAPVDQDVSVFQVSKALSPSGKVNFFDVGLNGDILIGAVGLSSYTTLRSGQFTTPLGSATTPSYSFTSDLNTGIYSSGADVINIATGGVERVRFTSTGATLTTPSSSTGGVNTLTLTGNTWTNSTLINKLINGTVTVNQSGTAGFDLMDFSVTQTSIGSGEKNFLRFLVNGSNRFSIDYNGELKIRPGVTNASSITLYNTSYGLGIDSTDTVMWASAATGISFKGTSVTGTLWARIRSTGLTASVPLFVSNATPNLQLESTAANAANAGTIIMRTPGGAESFTQTFNAATNVFSMLYGATTAMTITSTNVTSSLAHLFANGSASLPSLSFTSDTNTGMYRVNADQLGFATGGGNRLTITSSFATFTPIVQAPSFLAYNSTDSISTFFKWYGGTGGGGIYGEGAVFIHSADSSTPYADIEILAGENSSQTGGNINITAGMSEAGGVNGGRISQIGGYSYGGDGGYLSFVGGGAASGYGGYVYISGGDTGAGGGLPGGQVDIRGGINTNDSLYAPVYLQANGGLTSIGAGNFTVDTYGGAITSNIFHVFSNNTAFYGYMQTPSMPTSDPADGQGTLWCDTSTNIVYRGT